MGRLTFVFNQEKLNSANKSENDMLSPMREYAKANGIIESSTGVFELEGGGIVDDCIEDTLDWYREEGIAV